MAKAKAKEKKKTRPKNRVEAGLVEKDFEYQPRDEVIDAGEFFDHEAMEDRLAEERAAGAQTPTGVTLPEPSLKQNPYMSQEEQGMEMTPKTFGPPQYGSPNPETSASRLLTLEDGHPLDTLPEGHPAAISGDYAESVIGVSQLPGEGTHPGGPGRSDLDRHSSGDFTEEGNAEVDATDAARDLANSEGVDLNQVEGTGADGRVTKDDVEKFLADSEEDGDNS